MTSARAKVTAVSIALMGAIACSAGNGDEASSSAEDAVTNGNILNLGTLAHPGSCMDARAAGTANGTQIQEFQCNGTGAQSFQVVSAANGTIKLVNTAANKCLDVAAAGTANGTKIQLFDCNGTAAQSFVFRPAANGFVSIVNVASNKCVDVAGNNPANGTPVQLFDCNGTNAQLWNPTVIGNAGNAGGGGGAGTQCTGAALAACNCPNNFSCCPTDGSCFASADQVVFTKCKNNAAAVCTIGAGAVAGGGGGATGGGGAAGGNTGVACAAANNLRPGDRVLTITNQCPGQTISVGVNGGFVQDCVNGACPAGTTCSTGRNPPGCFFDLPAPACGSKVLATGATATFVLSNPAIKNIKWSGNVFASSQCASNGTGCKTAQCVTSLNGKTVVGACPNGTGPQGPTTLAEFTLADQGVDFYDVSSINGVNLPVSMGPIGQSANGYSCGTAGGIQAAGGLQGCSWAFNPNIPLNGAISNQAAVLRAVTPGGARCTSDAQCSGGQVCGTALAFGSAPVQSCGTQVAWWTADELCAATGNAQGGAIACNRTVPGQGTFANLYGCDGPSATSGFSVGAGANACGCPNWVVNGIPVPNANGFTCHADNPQWEAIAEPWAAFLKNACPTAYSFPFDDATSTFTCATPNENAANPNSEGYAITFCPGGRTGF